MRALILALAFAAFASLPVFAAVGYPPALLPLGGLPPELKEFALGLLADSNQTMLQVYGQLYASAQRDANGTIEHVFLNHSAIVVGNSLDAPEQALFEAVKTSYPIMQNMTTIDDSPESLAAAEGGSYAVIILIGGPAQNRVTAEFESRGAFNDSHTVKGEFVVKTGNVNGTLVIAFSDLRGFANAPRESAAHSPLASFVPVQYVPATATGISMFLLALISLAKTVFEFKALDVGRRGKKLGQGGLRVMGINLFEPIAVLGASCVVGISLSWQYFAFGPLFLLWVVGNTLIALAGGIIHELVHRFFALIFNVKVEYRFWWSGSALTLLSSYLGNAFSVQGFLLEDIPKETAKWKVGIMKLAAPLFSAFVMILFGVINALFPSVVFQMITASSGLWAMAEMFPFTGLDGKDVKEWNFFIWLGSFLAVGTAYFIVTFVL